MSEKGRRILAVASGGGHWVQLLRLRRAFEGHHVCFVSVRGSYAADVPGSRFRCINDATRWQKFGLGLMCMRLLLILLMERPHTVISTGAAPGYFAIRIGRLLGASTIWIDSIANVEQLSMTGQIVRRHADLWLTQWEHLASPEGPEYAGSVL